MRSSALASLAAVIFLVPASFAGAQTATTTNTPPQQQSSEKPDPDALICKRQTAITGTLLPAKQVCRTQREWDRLGQSSRDLTNNLQQKALLEGNPGG